MLIIGLTGISGSGKGYVCSIFVRHGIPCIDTDEIVHRLYESDPECIAQIRELFGDGVISDNGTVDRAALREIVFSDKEQLQKLNAAVHRHTLLSVDRRISEYTDRGHKAVVVDAPQLFESGYNKKCDVVISVMADNELRISRICKRDSISRDAAIARISNQKSDCFFADNSDYIVNNYGEDVENQVIRILEQLGLK